MAIIFELHKKLIDKELSSVELTKECLKKIKQKEKDLNAYITICEDVALKQAKEADKLLAAEDYTALTGIPYAVKDLFCTKGIKTTAGSKILEPYIPPYNATVINKLFGAVLLGKTNMDEFAMGSSGENSAYGPTKNPLDLSRVSGGSSAGSAATVAADGAIFSLGTDTGGSIRLPASFCGVVGLKPTYGRVSRYGTIAMTSSIDTVGALTTNVKDAAIVLQAIAGHDVFDSTSSKAPCEEYVKELDKEIKNMCVGIPKEYFNIPGLDPAVKAAIEKAIKKIEGLGVKVQEVSIPHAKYAISAYHVIVPSEVSSNLARFDGIKYGYCAKDAEDLLGVYQRSRSFGLGSEAKRRIMIGTYALSAGYNEAYYQQALKVRMKIQDDFKKVFKTVDCLIAPTAPDIAFKIGEKSKDPLAMYLADILTAPSSIVGLPGISIPAGKIDKMPIGLQIIANYFKESDMLRLAYHIERD